MKVSQLLAWLVFPLALQSLGCRGSDAPLLPSAQVPADGMIGALSRDASVVGWWNGAPLPAEVLDVARELPGMGPAVAEWETRAATLGDVDEAVMGCAPVSGCVGLVDGELAGQSATVLGEAFPVDTRADSGEPLPGSVAVRADERSLVIAGVGEAPPLLWHRLGEDKAAFGTWTSVQSLLSERSSGAPGFDAERLVGAVPDGELWAWTDAPEAWLRAALGSELAAELLLPDEAERVRGAMGIWGDRVEAVALSLAREASGTRGALRLSVASEDDAQELADLARPIQRAVAREHGLRLEVARQGRQVELTCILPDSELTP